MLPPRKIFAGSRACLDSRRHAPKKVPPPTSDGREGRLFPPEHFLIWPSFNLRPARPQTFFYSTSTYSFGRRSSGRAIRLPGEARIALSNHLPLRGAGRIFPARGPPLSTERSLQPGAPARFHHHAESHDPIWARSFRKHGGFLLFPGALEGIDLPPRHQSRSR